MVYHWLFAYLKPGYTKQHLAHISNKSEQTLINWIKTYEETGVFQRANPHRKAHFDLTITRGCFTTTTSTHLHTWTKRRTPSRARIA
jgi:transposase